MTTARSNISRGALLVALMSGSAFAGGGVAYADVLGGSGPVAVPAPLPVAVPLVGEPAPSPSATPSSTAAPQPSPTASAEPAVGGGSPTATPAPSAAPADQSVAASSQSAPAPVAAPPAGPASGGAAPQAAAQPGGAPLGASPLQVGAPAARPVVAPPGVAQPAASVPQTGLTLPVGDLAAARQDRLGLGGAALSFSGMPHLAVGSLELPALPDLPGLKPQIAAGDTGGLPALLGSAAAPAPAGAGPMSVVQAGNSAPMQPGSPVGVVLFVMAAAGMAAATARLRMRRFRAG